MMCFDQFGSDWNWLDVLPRTKKVKTGLVQKGRYLGIKRFIFTSNGMYILSGFDIYISLNPKFPFVAYL